VSSIAISLIVVAVVMAGALLGTYVRTRLPKHHLEDRAAAPVDLTRIC
jgi:uncharacterized protein YneF (UPF0154 family)